MMNRYENVPAQTSLLDLLDHVLDKGLVVAGDIRVSLANVELLTIKIRLLVCSVDKAQEIGMDWWRSDKFLGEPATNGAKELDERVRLLEQRLLGASGEQSNVSEQAEIESDQAGRGDSSRPSDGSAERSDKQEK